MGKKYIVELPETDSEFDFASIRPYTEPDLEQVRKEAYEKGYCIGYSKYLNKSYEDGLKDAWEAARWIADRPYAEGEKVFGVAGWHIIEKFTASEAIEKIRQYEQEKGKIQVGDQVENTQTGVKFIVTHLWKNNRGEQGVSGFNRECSAFSTTLSLVVKTGRHFPEIAAVLEKMRGEQDGKRREEREA